MDWHLFLGQLTAVLHLLTYIFLYSRVKLRVPLTRRWFSPAPGNAGWYYLSLYCTYRVPGALISTFLLIVLPVLHTGHWIDPWVLDIYFAGACYAVSRALNAVAHTFLYSAVGAFVAAAPHGSQQALLWLGRAAFGTGAVLRACYTVLRPLMIGRPGRLLLPGKVLTVLAWAALAGVAVWRGSGVRRREAVGVALEGCWVLLATAPWRVGATAFVWAAFAVQVSTVSWFLLAREDAASEWALPSWEECRNFDLRGAVETLKQRVRWGGWYHAVAADEEAAERQEYA